MYGDTVQLLYLLCFNIRIFPNVCQGRLGNLLTKLLTHLFTERR